jgi:hypothetical protein
MISHVALYTFENRAVAAHLPPSFFLATFAAKLQRTMPRAKWYSPQLRRDLVTRLYFRAQEEGIPMTRLVDRLIEQALAQAESDNHEIALRAAEEPTAAPVPG